jgi:hypothetical protein
VIARVLALAGGELVDLLGGPLGEQARAVRGEPASQAALRSPGRERAEVLARARAPVPPGLRGVHASWLEAALAELPPRARAAVAAGGGDAVDVWLARWACAGIPPLPPVRALDGRDLRPAGSTAEGRCGSIDGPRSIDDVIAMPDPEAWLVAVGRAQLAYATALARPGAPRKDELGPARAVIARCRGGDPLAIGARTVAPHATPLSRLQLAVRLERSRGLAVLAELVSHASAPISDGPSWKLLADAHVAG